MKALLYEVIFEATETLQNGKERRVKKGVLIPRFKDGKHVSPEQQIERGEAALKEAGFYKIQYIETKGKTLIYG